MIKLGYSSDIGSRGKRPIKDRISLLLSVNNEAIEIGYVRAIRLEEEVLDDEDIQKILQFKYRSIHAPAVYHVDSISGKKEWMEYPSPKGIYILDKILDLAKRINADSIVFHPDVVTDFNWLDEKVGSLLAFENMDNHKAFGSSIADMKEIFQQAPHAKRVCDVNHIYTVDPSMKLADEFHAAFGERLCHYHISGFGGHHDCFHISKEDIIMEGIKDLDKPMINEGGASRDEETLKKENEYILKYIEEHQQRKN